MMVVVSVRMRVLRVRVSRWWLVVIRGRVCARRVVRERCERCLQERLRLRESLPMPTRPRPVPIRLGQRTGFLLLELVRDYARGAVDEPALWHAVLPSRGG